jgi:hypothetical protein
VKFNITPSLFSLYPKRTGLKLGRSEFLALSRLAALQGHVVSYREFRRLAENLDGLALSRVPLAGKIAALWRSRFPQGNARVPNWPPSPSDIPALWLVTTKTEGCLLLVMGAQANGSLIYLNEHGKLQVIRPEQAHIGHLLVLESNPGYAKVANSETLLTTHKDMSQPATHTSRTPLMRTSQLLSSLIALTINRRQE